MIVEQKADIFMAGEQPKPLFKVEKVDRTANVEM